MKKCCGCIPKQHPDDEEQWNDWALVNFDGWCKKRKPLWVFSLAHIILLPYHLLVLFFCFAIGLALDILYILFISLTACCCCKLKPYFYLRRPRFSYFDKLKPAHLTQPGEIQGNIEIFENGGAIIEDNPNPNPSSCCTYSIGIKKYRITEHEPLPLNPWKCFKLICCAAVYRDHLISLCPCCCQFEQTKAEEKSSLLSGVPYENEEEEEEGEGEGERESDVERNKVEGAALIQEQQSMV